MNTTFVLESVKRKHAFSIIVPESGISSDFRCPAVKRDSQSLAVKRF